MKIEVSEQEKQVIIVVPQPKQAVQVTPKGDKGDFPDINTLEVQNPPADTDNWLLQIVSGAYKRMTWGGIRTALKAYFDTIYQAIFTFDPNNKTDYLRKDGVFAPIPLGGGGGVSPIYLSNVASDVPGYKKLSSVPDALEVVKTITANNSTVYGETYLFDLPVDLSVVNAGQWVFDYWRSVSSAAQESYARIESFLRHVDGTETTTYMVESPSIDDTELTQRIITYTLHQFTALPTDRFGVRISFRTTRSANTTYSYIVGGLRGHSIISPVPPRHDYLRDKDGNLDFLHLNNAQKNQGALATGVSALPTIKDAASKVDDILETVNTKNIFDISKVSVGLLNTADGQLIPTFANRRTSDYMSVLPLTLYYLSINAAPYAPSRCCVYTSSKVYIRSQAITDPTPANAGYMRISTYDIVNDGVIALMQVESGSITPFVPFKIEQFNKDYLPEELDNVRMILPSAYYLTIGDAFQLFWRSVVESPMPSQYYIQARCTKGLSLPRYYEFTPAVSDIGDTILTIDVRDNSYNLIATQQTTMKIKNSVTQPATLKQACCVGDSLTDGDDKWHNEFFRRLKNTDSVTSQGDAAPTGKGYANISGIGTRGTINYNEGHSGWNWDSYTTSNSASGNYFITVVNYGGKDPVADQHSIYKDVNNKQWKLETITQTSIKILPVIAGGALPASGTLIWVSGGSSTTSIAYPSSVAEAGNPFWNVALNRLDFTNYYNNLAASGRAIPGGSIDVMYIFLTWNFGVSYVNAYTKDFWSIEVAKIKTFIDRLHVDFPLCKVKLMSMPHPSYNGGCGYSYGANGGYSEWYGMVRAINGQSLAYADLASQPSYVSFVEYIHVSGQVDSEYNMQWSNFKVNSRNTLILRRDTNGIHPAKEGYYQIADAAYRNFIANYCQ